MESNDRRYGVKLKQLSRAFEKVINSNCARMDLTCAQSMMLRYLSLHREEPVYARDLERHFNLTHPTVSGLLQRLEAKGFVRLEPDRQDRRCKRIAVTQKALDNHDHICSAMGQLEQCVVSGFSAEEQDLFWELLCRAAVNVENFSNHTETEESE